MLAVEASTYALFVAAAVALIVAPGPDTLFVLSQGIESRRAGVRAALGVTGGIVFHTTLVVVGVATVYQAVPGAKRVVQAAGALYVGFLGVTTLLDDRGDDPTPAAGGGVRGGFLINALNPQVALFFLAFLPGFAAGDGGGATDASIAVFGLTYAALTAAYLGGVALVADGAAGVFQSPQATRRLDIVAGVVLIATAGWLVVG